MNIEDKEMKKLYDSLTPERQKFAKDLGVALTREIENIDTETHWATEAMALDDAKKAARDLQDVYTDFDRKTKGSISNSERNSVSVYSDSLDVLGDAYTEIKNRINTASKLKLPQKL